MCAQRIIRFSGSLTLDALRRTAELPSLYTVWQFCEVDRLKKSLSAIGTDLLETDPVRGRRTGLAEQARRALRALKAARIACCFSYRKCITAHNAPAVRVMVQFG